MILQKLCAMESQTADRIRRDDDDDADGDEDDNDNDNNNDDNDDDVVGVNTSQHPVTCSISRNFAESVAVQD
jgi:cobalamin biosynthesis protein CobT